MWFSPVIAPGERTTSRKYNGELCTDMLLCGCETAMTGLCSPNLYLWPL